ncbi:hypothetical protein ILUMI_24195 [Ignelater luminosus]|uniref:Uncharacterized protein n=1 Tax=Ignelater luminosus TaxID=2038154 RepID=A0A8K0CDX2_IGNLU|nr:hypothetical protein ILUMI_24195 [Ignelater luminosus]
MFRSTLGMSIRAISKWISKATGGPEVTELTNNTETFTQKLTPPRKPAEPRSLRNYERRLTIKDVGRQKMALASLGVNSTENISEIHPESDILENSANCEVEIPIRDAIDVEGFVVEDVVVYDEELVPIDFANEKNVETTNNSIILLYEHQENTHSVDNIVENDHHTTDTTLFTISERTKQQENIFQKKVQVAKKKKIEGSSIVFQDRKEKHSPKNKTSEVRISFVRRDIESFPVMASHCRSKTNRQYLASDLNITKMYELYLDKCKEENVNDPVSAVVYRKTFCSKSSCAFRRPKKDGCSVCKKYRFANVEEKTEMQRAYRNMENKELARKKNDTDKKRAKVDPNFKSVIFDLQSVLYTPYSEVLNYYHALKFYLQALKATLTVGKMSEDTEDNTINWMNVKMLQFKKNCPQIIKIKKSIVQEPALKKNTSNRFFPISEKKKKSLVNLCRVDVMPAIYHIYRSLPSNSSVVDRLPETD